ncbi:hypothetical protein AL346_17115 [Chelatococcus sp. CO-6]|nr:hypothetical protein AL346_17115 [Chelatococcus sp. CO-6]
MALGAGGLLADGAALAQTTKFDGSWSVLVVTEAGNCDRAFRYPVGVAGGIVQYTPQPGAPAVDLSGRIDPRGRVNVRIRRGADTLTATGRVEDGRGSGTWRTPTRGCSGYWQAERRGP